MTRRIDLQLVAIVSDDGTRCAAECPHVRTECIGSIDEQWFCDANGGHDLEPVYSLDAESFTGWARHPACIAAEVSTVEGES